MSGLLALQAERVLTDVHEFVADIPAGGTVELSLQSKMAAYGVISEFRDANTENNDALREIASRPLEPAVP